MQGLLFQICTRTLRNHFLKHKSKYMYSHISDRSGQKAPLTTDDVYEIIMKRWFTHASPTLFNAGTPRPQSNWKLHTWHNRTSDGIIPMSRVFNDTARYVDQGGGKRKGAFAVYLEPWHADIFEFLEALGLADCWGKDFENLYTQYERQVSLTNEKKRITRSC
ncbi:unnamed protein product [Lactuca virosa]|uniref:Ribonucleoside-diphosphate reductase n=1 Tax=Lactuca virosa TaxID=75947 RepID=A0AAU9NQM5_9ASTR|nr:unnamed protein product [Lactuca virosa]